MNWFSNVTLFRIPEIDTEALNEALLKRPFAAVSGLDWFSEGWVPPTQMEDSPVQSIGGIAVVALHRQDKVLPAGAIRERLEAKIREIEANEMRKLGRKEKAELKEQITDDMLPHAFTKSARTRAYLDQEHGWLVVDSGSQNKAETFVSSLRDACPPFPAPLPRTEQSPRTVMTGWLLDGEAAGEFELDAEVTLTDSAEGGSIIRVQRSDLTADDIRKLLDAGRQVTQIGLIWRERIRFTLTDTLQIKKLRFLDVLQEEASNQGDTADALIEACYTLMAGELSAMIDDLIEQLGGLVEVGE